MEQIISNGGYMSPFIMLFVQMTKSTGLIPSKYIPIVSAGIGLGSGFILGFILTKGHFTIDLAVMSLSGIVGAAGANGLYKVIQNNTSEEKKGEEK
ncbi:hypothetical protein QL848_002264 [Enterococcus faecium]|nr:hypothetical protein [Enterococcus faecium]